MLNSKKLFSGCGDTKARSLGMAIEAAEEGIGMNKGLIATFYRYLGGWGNLGEFLKLF